MRSFHTRLAGVACALIAAATGTAMPARAYTAEITFTASDFLARSGGYLTGEIPPQAEVSGSFTVSTDQPRDLPDEPFSVVDDGGGYQGVNTWTAPVAANLEIAGTAYPVEDIQVHLGFVEGAIAEILVSARAGRLPEQLPAHITTAGTEDFMLALQIPGPAGGRDGYFGYTVTETAISGFVALRGHATVASDSGPIEEFDWVPPLVIEGIPCYVARPSPGEATPLEGGADPGVLICQTEDGEVVVTDGTADRLRDVRLAAGSAERSASAGGLVTLTTQLGTVTLKEGRTDRLLLAAAAGRSSQVQPPDAAAGGSFRCAKVRHAPGTPRFQGPDEVWLDDAASGSFRVRQPTRHCVASDGASADLLCYAARAKGRGPSRSELWVAHELGTEKLTVGRAREICLPVSEGGE